MCHERWALHVVIKRKIIFYIYMVRSQSVTKYLILHPWTLLAFL